MYKGAKEILVSNNDRLFYFETLDGLIEALPSILKKDDTILVKASHFMGLDRLVEKLQA